MATAFLVQEIPTGSETESRSGMLPLAVFLTYSEMEEAITEHFISHTGAAPYTWASDILDHVHYWTNDNTDEVLASFELPLGDKQVI